MRRQLVSQMNIMGVAETQGCGHGPHSSAPSHTLFPAAPLSIGQREPSSLALDFLRRHLFRNGGHLAGFQSGQTAAVNSRRKSSCEHTGPFSNVSQDRRMVNCQEIAHTVAGTVHVSTNCFTFSPRAGITVTFSYCSQSSGQEVAVLYGVMLSFLQ